MTSHISKAELIDHLIHHHGFTWRTPLLPGQLRTLVELQDYHTALHRPLTHDHGGDGRETGLNVRPAVES